MTNTICDGLTVLEVGAASIAGSFAGMLLADAGARVIKVEPPDGDRLRRETPAGFLVWNRGKESVVADLRTDAGRAQYRALAAGADVVIEGFGPGVADAWGVGSAALRSANPRLVYCSVKGFGAGSPYARIPSYEGIVVAKSGNYNLGPFGFRPGPIFFSAHLASLGAGHHALGGIAAALIAREKTGRGQDVEATLFQGLNSLDYFGTMTLQFARKMAAQSGGAAAPSGIAAVMNASRFSFLVPTKDGRWVAFTQMMPHQSQALSRALGLEHTITDPRYDKQPFFPGAEDAQGWEDLVWEAMRSKTYAELEPLFLAEPDIAFEMARTSEEGLDHAQIRHNGEAIAIQDPDHGTVRQVGPVAQFASTPAAIQRSAPRLGEHGDLSTTGAPGADAAGRVAPKHPLEGITIIELGFFYAMPFGITLAASLGAKVIKIEGEKGDPMRVSFGPPDTGGAKTMEGKESLAVDLQTPEGREIVQKLAAGADMFVNGFRPGVAERLGLGYDELKALNPKLVYVKASGYGAEGPYASRPIYAQVAQAVAGSINRYGGSWCDPALTAGMTASEAQIVVMPRVRGVVDGDSNAALGVFSSVMLGLLGKQRTGEGQLLTTSMIGGNAMMYSDDFVAYAGKPKLPQQDEENWGLSALYRIYPAASGYVFLAVTRQAEWDRFVRALGDSSIVADDARFTTAAGRGEHDAELMQALEKVFADRDAQAWEDLLVPAEVACARIPTAERSEVTITDENLRVNGLVVEAEHPLFGTVVRHGLPVTMSETPGRVAAGCLAGQHTDSILAGVGYSDKQIAELKERKVVFGR